MTGLDLLRTGWDGEPSVVIGCAALVLGYLALVRRRLSWSAAYFFGAILLLLLDLVSPLDLLGDRYLFSAHIVQHVVLALVIPPLLLAGMPRRLAAAALKSPILAGLETRIARPPVSWTLGVGTMIFWHVPVFFNASLAHDGLHVLQHLSFLVTGTIFWWPILSPLEERRISPLAALSYLFSACLSCSFLGAALTFARPGLYPAYLNPTDTLGILPLIRGNWGLDPANDQQLGGLLMWVPGCFIYLTGILVITGRWYGAKQQTQTASVS